MAIGVTIKAGTDRFQNQRVIAVLPFISDEISSYSCSVDWGIELLNFASNLTFLGGFHELTHTSKETEINIYRDDLKN